MRQKSELRSYQQRLITHLYENLATIVVARMGSGKTGTALSTIEELLLDKHIRHALIVAPKRVATFTWPDEIKAWAHLAGLRFEVLNSYGPKRRHEVLERAGHDHEITLLGVDHVQWLSDALVHIDPSEPVFDLLVLDEISRFRSPKSKRGKALFKHIPQFRAIWGMTGTIAPNGLQDLFGPAKLVSKGELWGKSFYSWRQERFYPADFQGYTWLPKFECRAGIIQEFASISVVLEDKDMPDLPELVTIEHRVELDPETRAVYKQMQSRLVAELDDKDVVAVNAAVAAGKLGQLSAGFIYDTDENGARTVNQLHNVKLDWLEELVEDIRGRPLLIIYEYQHDLDAITARLGKLPMIGPGVSDKQTRETIDAWNRRELPLMIMHAASGGHGLNLQAGGSDIAWLNLTWSPELYEQTIARLHRPGQTEKVIVNICVASGTVDEAKRARVLDKMSAQAAFQRFLDRI